MKKMSRLLAILLALTLVFSLAACSGSSGSSGSIAGKWTCNFDAFSIVDLAWSKEAHGPEDQHVYDLLSVACKNVSIGMVMTLNEDKTCEITVDEASLQAAAEMMKKNMSDNLFECMTIMSGVSEADLRAQMEAKGMSEADLQEMIASQVDTSALLQGMMVPTQTGTYTYENGKLLITDEKGSLETWVVSLSGNKLTVTDIISDSESDNSALEEFLPMVFTR